MNTEQKLNEEIEEYENIVNEEEWGTYETFFEKEYKNLHKDMFADGILFYLIDKSIAQAELKGFQKGREDWYKNGFEDGKLNEQAIKRDLLADHYQAGRKETIIAIGKMLSFTFDEMELQYNGDEHSMIPIHLSDLKDYKANIFEQIEGLKEKPIDSLDKSITFDIQKEEKAKPTREDYLDNPSDNLTSSEQLILSEILANNSTAIALLKLKDAKAKYFAENLIEEMKNE